MALLRILLLPFSALYYLIAAGRNFLYDKGLFKSYRIPVRSICVGNLSVGGTGKTPMVAYLADHFSSRVPLAILSRGYGRSTKGYLKVHETLSTYESGDEPLLYARRHFPNTMVAVCESRKTGVERIIYEQPETGLILLDDAYQHMAVQAGFNVLLTPYSNPFSKDLLLPAGRLREPRSGKKRAHAIVVTKCPSDLEENQKEAVNKDLAAGNIPVYFSSIRYGIPVKFGKALERPFKKVLLVTGIADPKPLLDHLRKEYEVESVSFPDHHDFSRKDIENIHQKFDTFASDEMVILVTEKDYMRLYPVISEWNIERYPWYYQPITVSIDRENEFLEQIERYVGTI